jgi:hypothetical protein
VAAEPSARQRERLLAILDPPRYAAFKNACLPHAAVKHVMARAVRPATAATSAAALVASSAALPPPAAATATAMVDGADAPAVSRPMVFVTSGVCKVLVRDIPRVLLSRLMLFDLSSSPGICVQVGELVRLSRDVMTEWGYATRTLCILASLLLIFMHTFYCVTYPCIPVPAPNITLL